MDGAGIGWPADTRGTPTLLLRHTLSEPDRSRKVPSAPLSDEPRSFEDALRILSSPRKFTRAAALAVLIGALRGDRFHANAATVFDELWPVSEDRVLHRWPTPGHERLPAAFWQAEHVREFDSSTPLRPHRTWLDVANGRARRVVSCSGDELPYWLGRRVAAEIGEGREHDQFIRITDVEGLSLDLCDIEDLARDRRARQYLRPERVAARIGRPREWPYEDAWAALVVSVAKDGLPGAADDETTMLAALTSFLEDEMISLTGDSPDNHKLREFARRVVEKWKSDSKSSDAPAN